MTSGPAWVSLIGEDSDRRRTGTLENLIDALAQKNS